MAKQQKPYRDGVSEEPKSQKSKIFDNSENQEFSMNSKFLSNKEMKEGEKTTICNSHKCPFHGNLSIRGRKLIGTLISTKMRNTSIIEFERIFYLGKYERYEKRRTTLKVHNPDCIDAKEGDIVEIMECRPISKTKNFVIVKKVGVEKGFKEKMDARESSKITQRKEEITEAH